MVSRDVLWACDVFPGFEVPGWFVLRTRRHVLNMWNLDAHEAASYGTQLRQLTRAIRETLDPPAIYTMSFGERHPHFHALVIARGQAVPQEHRSEKILALRDAQRDPDAARTVADAVGEAYRRLQ